MTDGYAIEMLTTLRNITDTRNPGRIKDGMLEALDYAIEAIRDKACPEGTCKLSFIKESPGCQACKFRRVGMEPGISYENNNLCLLQRALHNQWIGKPMDELYKDCPLEESFTINMDPNQRSWTATKEPEET